MKTQILAYKGFLAIAIGEHVMEITPSGTETGPDSVTMSIDDLEITQEAYDILKNVPIGENGLGAIVAYNDGTPKFGYVCSGPKMVVHENDILAKVGYDPKVLEPSITTIELPESLVEYVDSLQLVDGVAVDPVVGGDKYTEQVFLEN